MVERPVFPVPDKAPEKVLLSEFGLSMHLETQRRNETRNVLIDFGYSSPTLLNNLDVLPESTSLRTLAETIKGRWQAHQQLKEELGLDHFEGRSWQGLHRHALMTMIAYAFLQFRKKESTGRRPSQACPRYGTPFSLSSSGHRYSSGLTAEIGYTKSGGMNEFCQSSARGSGCISVG